jgi:hypothetical protein
MADGGVAIISEAVEEVVGWVALVRAGVRAAMLQRGCERTTMLSAVRERSSHSITIPQ